MLRQLRRSPHQRGCLGHRDMAARGLYKATDGSWRQADAKTGVRFLYKLRGGERWTLLDRDRVMVVHPDRPPKIVCPDGRVEEIASKANAQLSKLTTPTRTCS